MYRFLRVVFWTTTVCVLSLTLAVGPLFLQDQPSLKASPPPTPTDVATTRQLVRDLRQASVRTPNNASTIQTNITQLNSAIRLGGRFIDGFRGNVALENQAIHGRVSFPIPWWRGQKWLNISGTVPEFQNTIVLKKITVGSTDVPPALTLSAARIVANLMVGDGFGDKMTNAASEMRIEGDTVQFDVTLNQIGENGIMQNVFGSIRGSTFPSPEEIDAYYLRIRGMMDDGHLPTTNSFLPYIQFALSDALKTSTVDTLPNAYTAAIFGLARACGAADFGAIAGRLAVGVTDTTKEWETSCDDVTFNGRIDSRRHFITSAALQAATNNDISFSFGELKELYDIVSSAGGYDFTDIAANMSGIRMSDYLMSLSSEDWPDTLERLRTERDVIISFEEIPSLMPEADFNARYGSVESDVYKDMLTHIKGRIDQLYLYRAN